MIFFSLSFLISYAILLLLTNKNPVYSVLSLVLFFVSGSIILLLLKLDFLAFVFIIVYVGAVAVLFLFVVIILDIKISNSEKNGLLPFYVLGYWLVVFFFLNANSEIKSNISFIEYIQSNPVNYHNSLKLQTEVLNDNYSFSNISLLGIFLYSEYDLHFVIGGLILLLAIVGAIVLTRKTSVKSKVHFDTKQFERSSSIYRRMPNTK